MATVTWGPLNAELGFSFELLNDSYAAGCGSLCIGGVILIPFALKYGRRPVYVFSTIAQCAFCVWQARMQTVADLMSANILSSMVGALAEVLVQMTVADVYFVHQRGLMNSIYVWFMTVGATLSPLAGGYIVISQGWRWVWWWMVILMGAGLVAFVFLYEETKFSPTLEGVVPVVAAAQINASAKGRDKKSPTDPEVEANVAHKDGETQRSHATHWIDHSIPVKPYWKKASFMVDIPGVICQHGPTQRRTFHSSIYHSSHFLHVRRLRSHDCRRNGLRDYSLFVHDFTTLQFQRLTDRPYGTTSVHWYKHSSFDIRTAQRFAGSISRKKEPGRLRAGDETLDCSCFHTLRASRSFHVRHWTQQRIPLAAGGRWIGYRYIRNYSG